MKNNFDDAERYRSIIIELALESWRFSRVFCNMLEKINDYNEYTRCQGRYSWFRKKLDEILDEAGMKIVEFDSGTDYEIGMAVDPINLCDFNSCEQLQIEQMLEPVFMQDNSVIKNGKVILRRLKA